MWKKLQNWIRRTWSRFRYVIRVGGEPYLVRYRILKTPWFGVYLHHILVSDRDRALHDHPWSFFSLVLWGAYKEYLFSDSGDPEEAYEYRGLLSGRMRKAEDYHRIEIIRPCWTLFVVGPKTRSWGFLTEEGWVEHRQYRENLVES